MLKPSADLIIPPELSRYSLVVAVAKRARQIAAEAEARGEILIEKPVDLAVKDFANHKFRIVEAPKEEEMPEKTEETDEAEESAENATEEPATTQED